MVEGHGGGGFQSRHETCPDIGEKAPVLVEDEDVGTERHGWISALAVRKCFVRYRRYS